MFASTVCLSTLGHAVELHDSAWHTSNGAELTSTSTSTVHLPLQVMQWSCPMSSIRPLWMASTTLQTNWFSRTLSSTTGPTLLTMATPMGKGTMMQQEALASSTPRWAGSCSASVHGAKNIVQMHAWTVCVKYIKPLLTYIWTHRSSPGRSTQQIRSLSCTSKPLVVR